MISIYCSVTIQQSLFCLSDARMGHAEAEKYFFKSRIFSRLFYREGVLYILTKVISRIISLKVNQYKWFLEIN